MASPAPDARIEPHRKSHFNLNLSEQMGSNDSANYSYNSIKYNHKPTLTSYSGTTNLTSTSSNSYNLRLEDTKDAGKSDIFTFTGQKSVPTKSYVLLFDPANNQATLEPLSSSYAFNIASKNNKDISTQHAKIYVKKTKDGTEDHEDDDGLFGNTGEDVDGGDPDEDNPYDFRHFLSKEKDRPDYESDDGYTRSPDSRISSANTSLINAINPAPTSAPKPKASTVAKKKKPAATNLLVPTAKRAQPAPTVRLQRRATDNVAPEPAPKSKGKIVTRPISTEFVHSSEESDLDADGEATSSSSALVPRSPSPIHHQPSDHSDEDDDIQADADSDGGLEIEVPDARPVRGGKGALVSLGLGQNIGVGGYLRSPSNGPISLASATNSATASPSHNAFSRSNQHTQDEIDFGDMDGDEEEEEEEEEDGDGDGDVEPINIGPPAKRKTSAHERKASVAAGMVGGGDDEDDLEAMMMAGFEESEESEEE